MDTGCSYGSTGNQSGTYESNRIPDARRLGTKRGFVAVKPNCSIQSYAPVLTAWKEFEPYEVVATTYQAISGAGKTFKDWPEMVGNIIPYIGGEEEKIREGAASYLG